MAASDYVPIFFKIPLASRGASTDEYVTNVSHSRLMILLTLVRQ